MGIHDVSPGINVNWHAGFSFSLSTLRILHVEMRLAFKTRRSFMNERPPLWDGDMARNSRSNQYCPLKTVSRYVKVVRYIGDDDSSSHARIFGFWNCSRRRKYRYSMRIRLKFCAEDIQIQSTDSSFRIHTPVLRMLSFICVFLARERTRRFRWWNERVFSIISARTHSEATSPFWRCARVAKCQFIHNIELTYRFACGNSRLLRHESFWHNISILCIFHE